MTRWLRVAAAAALVAAALPLASAVPAQADPLAACTPSSGTIVAVDFGRWGGPVVRGCGAHPGNGYELLHDGGFSTAGTQHDGPAFICRIGSGSFHGGAQYPTAAQDACVTTPPSTAYWSYWVAPAGATSWSYSRLGAMSYHPQPGEVDLWTFGATSTDGGSGAPPYPPSSLRAAVAPPASHAPPATAPATHSAPAPPATGTATTSTTARPGAAGASSSTSTPAPAAASSSTAPAPRVVTATAADPPHTGGSATPALAGAAVVGVVALAGGALAWRRRAR